MQTPQILKTVLPWQTKKYHRHQIDAMEMMNAEQAKSSAVQSTAPIIDIQHLNHYFGKGALRNQVLFDINLQVSPGEIVIMTGPSGSGKTTLLTLIGALRSANMGSLKVLNRELQGASTSQRTQVRREIGFIFQAHNLLPFMTARQNVRMALELRDYPDRQKILYKADQILERVGLVNQIGSYPEKLSGGQKQRVAIARALVNEPALVLADEPTASLDKKSGRDVVQLMQVLAKEQRCAILLVTHDNRILDIADRIVYIESGRLLRDQKQTPSTYSPSEPESAISASASVSFDSVEETSPTALAQTTTLPTPDQPTVMLSLPSTCSDFKTYTVACIDSSLQNLETLKQFLDDDLFTIALMQNPVQALMDIPKYCPDLILLRAAMPEMSGYALAQLLRQNPKFSETPIVLMTEKDQKVDNAAAKSLNIEHVLTAPFSQTSVITTLFPLLT